MTNTYSRSHTHAAEVLPGLRLEIPAVQALSLAHNRTTLTDFLTARLLQHVKSSIVKNPEL